MVRPDRIKKIQLCLLISVIPLCALFRNTIPHVRNPTAEVRFTAARLELTFSMAIFAKIGIRTAKMADRNIKANYISYALLSLNGKTGGNNSRLFWVS